MKLDTEEEWKKMASTAVGFIGGFCLHIRLARGFHFILCAFRRLF